MKKTLVAHDKRFTNLYSLFNMDMVYDKMKHFMLDEDFSTHDAIYEVDQDFADQVCRDKNFNPDYIARYIYDVENGADLVYNNMNNIYYNVLQYIFDEYISNDVGEAIIYNECVDYINEHDICISEDELRGCIIANFNWNYAFREVFDSFTRQLKAEYGKPSVGKSLAKQLNLKVGDTFTNDGITYNSRWIGQQQLLHILYDGLNIRKVDE